MSQKKALFVGLNTVDLQFSVVDYPKSNTKIKATKNAVFAGGPATNAAITHSFLGGEAHLLSPIGNHSLTKFLLDEISSHGVRILDPIENIESKPVFASIITSEINGERTIFSYHPENNHTLLNELHLTELSSYDIALFDGFYLDLAIPIARELKIHKIPTVLDGGSWKPGLEDLLPYIDIAICSNDFYPPNVKERNDQMAILSQFGISKIAVTRGAQSIRFWQETTEEKITIAPVKTVDTLAAGDIFHGAFCYYYSLNSNFSDSLKLASLVASESCKHFGTRQWMEKFIPAEF